MNSGRDRPKRYNSAADCLGGGRETEADASEGADKTDTDNPAVTTSDPMKFMEPPCGFHEYASYLATEIICVLGTKALE